MGDCQHQRGDKIKERGFWLCADCFAKMDARPSRYGMVPQVLGSDSKWTGPLQQIVWQADQAVADGLALNDFLRTMARRFMQKTRPSMAKDDAYDMAISVLKTLGDTYGDPAYDWSHDGARELADDEMTYWEADNAGAN